jgi:hypothetical protein
MQTSESKNVKKKSKKTFNLVCFLDHKCTGQFTIFGASLPVIPAGKPVIPTSYDFNRLRFQKLNFEPVFTLTGQTGGDRFWV